MYLNKQEQKVVYLTLQRIITDLSKLELSSTQKRILKYLKQLSKKLETKEMERLAKEYGVKI